MQQPGPNLLLENNALKFNSVCQENIRIDVYTLRGNKLYTSIDGVFGPGPHLFPMASILRGNTANYLRLLKITNGNEQRIVTITPTGPASFSAANGTVSGNAVSQAQLTAAVEVLIASKPDYQSRSLDITAYTAQNVGDIVLSTVVDDSATIERKIDSIMALMANNNALKAGQMSQVMNTAVTPADVTQYGFGSIFNGGEEPVSPNTPANWASRLDQLQSGALASTLKIPMIYGLDAVHGNGKVVGSTIFPHNIGLGCTHDTALVEQVGRITAAECAAVGIHLTFAPCVPTVRDERWGRTYEGFGETPEINTQMGTAYLRGLQGDGDISNPAAIAGCFKHYLGDGGTGGGTNGGITTLSDATMRAIHFPQYIAGARAKMACIMPSYSSWSRGSGQPAIKQTLDSVSVTGMLKREQNWDGFVLSDYDAIPQAAGSYNPASVAAAIRAGVDMAMIPNRDSCMKYIQSIQTAVSQGLLPQSRVDDAVRRILRIKFRMHLWDHPKSQASLISLIGNADHRAVARDAVRKSLVLLKNSNNALPLKTTDKVLVVGPWADSMGAQCGGWTIGWQGVSTYTPANVGGGQTIFQGLQQVGGAGNVTIDERGTTLGTTTANKIVVVVGELPYAEGMGDSANPALSRCRYSPLIDSCYKTGKTVIVVMISGRPLLITDKLALCSAFVAAWLPGTEGIGVADVLYGNYNFTGKITHTWANTLSQIPINTGTVYADEPKGSGGTPLFEYGYGLTY
jgi:beta-glucosidase